MNPLTNEWVDKAEGDFNTAGRERRVRKAPNYDAVCFHSQQAAEKYLKAVLQESSLAVPRTHNLADLLALCLKIDNTFLLIQPHVNTLDGYAVQFRYPGQSAEIEEASAALKAVTVIRTFIRNRFGLPPQV